jgi:hypothetical protein
VRILVMALALIGLSTGAASAQHPLASVEGTVRDTAGRPLAAVQVFIVGTWMATRTDSLGRYEFDSLAAGPARLRTAIIGFASKEQSTVLTAGERRTVDFRVAPSPVSDPGNIVRSVPLEKADSH